MRDWRSAFRRASFRGVSFWVESDGPERGRRVAVHEISGGSRPVVEDMGRKATSFGVEAYVASDQADFEGMALEVACDAAGSALLVLPMDSGRLAYCTDCSRDRRKDRNGMVAYSLSFVEAGASASFGGGGIGALRDAFASGLSLAASAIAARW